MEEKEAWKYGMFCHLAAFAALLGVPFGNIIGPLVVWLLKKEDHPFIDEQGRASLNFQISMTIYSAAAVILVFVIIGVPILLGLVIYNFIMVVMASIKASEGKTQRYPLSIRFM
ncbi:MAG: DUF4870 domain-containing protein [Planctomycetota bacterium]|jgi:uncharacterized Tic20 family protein